MLFLLSSKAVGLYGLTNTLLTLLNSYLTKFSLSRLSHTTSKARGNGNRVSYNICGCSIQNKYGAPAGIGRQSLHNPASQLAVNERPPPPHHQKLQPPCLQDVGAKTLTQTAHTMGHGAARLFRVASLLPIPRCPQPRTHATTLTFSTPAPLIYRWR